MSSRMKRRADGRATREASSSKQYVNKIVGAEINASDFASVSIENIHVQVLEQQQPIPEEPPSGIDFQVADPIVSFRGRDKELEDVKQTFDLLKNRKQFNLVAVCGYGGIGKTEFARKYIQHNRDDFENILWIYAEFETSMRDSFNKLQKKLGDNSYRCSGQQDVYNFLNSDKCIFVFDNAENMKSIRPFLPKKSNKSLFLITSQLKSWTPYQSIKLDRVDLENAKNIMEAVLVDEYNIQISEDQLQELVCKLEFIPLVLQIVAGFICKQVTDAEDAGSECNIDDIIQELDHKSDLITKDFPDFSSDPYSKSVFEALCRTLEKIWNKGDTSSKTAANMLGISAYLSTDHITKGILKELLKADEALFKESLAILVQYSLFHIADNIRIHRTVQECVRYYCRNKLNYYNYYLQTLHILLIDDYNYWQHQKVIMQHGESNQEIFRTFYDGNKCRTLYLTFTRSISCQMFLQLIKNNFDLMNNIEFLCEVAVSNREDMIHMLRDQNVNFNATDNNGFNILYYACLPREGYFQGFHFSTTLSITWDRIESLLRSGADVNLRNNEGNTVIHILCNLGKSCAQNDEYIFELCALMIKAGADANIKNYSDETPSDLARRHGLSLTLKLLDRVVSGYRYILQVAAMCRQYEFLQCVSGDKICDINEQDQSGSTVFHVLAGLAKKDVNESKLLYSTAELLRWYSADVNIINNAGETAEAVARQCGREYLAELLHSNIQPGSIILCLDTLRSKIGHFSFVCSRNKMNVNDEDDTGNTLLHALCDLNTQNDSELELDIVKFAAELVIRYEANVSIRNTSGDTCIDVAGRHGRPLLIDFLKEAHDCSLFERVSLGENLVSVAVKHKQYDLVKFAWWRYCYRCSSTYIDNFPDGSDVLRILCGYKDITVTDAELLQVINDLNLNLMAKYDEKQYLTAVVIAKEHGRDELAAGLISLCDFNEQDDSGCTRLHILSSRPGKDKKEEEDTFNRVIKLVKYCGADVSIMNNASETAETLARRCVQTKLADLLKAWVPFSLILNRAYIYNRKIQHFPFASNNSTQDVNYQDETSSTLLHALFDLDLDALRDSELELDIVKLAVHLVIEHHANVRIMNNERETAAEVAQSRGLLLLADFLNSAISPTVYNFISVSVKYKQFDLIKYAWWRYLYIPSKWKMYGGPDEPGCCVLRILCESENPLVCDAELITLIDYLDLNQVAVYSNDVHINAIETARMHHREDLADWLQLQARANEFFRSILKKFNPPTNIKIE